MNTNLLALQLYERTAVRDSISGARYERQVNCVDSAEDSSSTDSQPTFETAGTQSARCHREVHLAFFLESYKPLTRYDEEREKAREEKKRRKKEKYKKVKKNVRKALKCTWKCTWKCLVLGLYNFALGYSAPMSVVTTFSPDFHQGQNWP